MALIHHNVANSTGHLHLELFKKSATKCNMTRSALLCAETLFFCTSYSCSSVRGRCNDANILKSYLIWRSGRRSLSEPFQSPRSHAEVLMLPVFFCFFLFIKKLPSSNASSELRGRGAESLFPSGVYTGWLGSLWKTDFILLLMKLAVYEGWDHVEARGRCEGAVFTPQDEVRSVKWPHGFTTWSCPTINDASLWSTDCVHWVSGEKLLDGEVCSL